MSAAPALVADERADGLPARLAELVAGFRAERRFPALGVGVVHDGQVLCCHTADGSADPDPDSQRRVFGLGSNSKLLVMAGVLAAVERGRLALDDPVNDHLSELRVEPPNGVRAAITVRQLLTHTAGLESWRSKGDLWRFSAGEVLAADEQRPDLVSFYRGRLRGAQPPGEMFIYSDHSYAVLGQLLADVESVPMEEAVERLVLGPLGMAESGYPPYRGLREPEPGHETDGSPATLLRQVLVAPTSGIVSVRDMTLFAWALSHGGANPFGRVFGPDVAAQVLHPQYRLHPRFPALGMQFIVCGHDPVVGVMRGAYSGWVSWVAVSLDLRCAIVLLGNRHGPLDRLGRAILDAVTGRPDVAMLDAGPLPPTPGDPPAAPEPAVRIPRDLRGVYAPLPAESVTCYSSGEVAVLTGRRGLRLRDVWRQPNRPRVVAFEPVAGEPDLYTLEYPWAKLYAWFRRDADGRVCELVFGPFDRFRRLSGAQVALIPVYRALSAAFFQLKWWAGARRRRRL